jgi:succinate-semialdehyde dehydrogenase/glutarate-semialdehyde dehydrogenase
MVLIGKSDDDCLQLANNTRFGLGNSIWTRNKEKAFFLLKIWNPEL